MAAYREPDRVQVKYVTFELSNYLAAAELKIGKTNLENQVEGVIRSQGMEAVRGAKTVEEARTKLREYFLRQEQVALLKPVANEFATAVYAEKNLETVAKSKGLTVHTTVPFADNNAAADALNLPESFVAAAFKMVSEQQTLSSLVSGPDQLYLLALDKQIPSTVPPLEQVRARVTEDYRVMTAQNLARSAGLLFHSNVTAQITAGKTFAQAAVAAGQSPTLLKPFALSAAQIPEAGDRVEIRDLKQAAFMTPLGKASSFVPTSEGGFVLSPQTMEPVDAAKKAAAMPQYLTQVRRGRQDQAFNEWLRSELSRELRDTPVYAEMTGAHPAK